MDFSHLPVLPKETIDMLDIKKGGIYIDATIGGGGHSQLILDKIGPEGTLIGFDQDMEAINTCLEKFKENDNVILVNENFTQLDRALDKLDIDKVDGILADIGVSSYQLDNAERGFSFMKDAPLDMRMDKDNVLSAYDIVNNYDQAELARIFREFGEEKRANRIAFEIIKARSINPIETTLELADIAKKVLGKKEKIHPATRIFQALRIYVNKELESLNKFLGIAVNRIVPGGRLVVISFHSLEDRIVKRFFQEESKDCICSKELPICTCNHKAGLTILSRRPITVSDKEKNINPRARSAKMRVVEIL